MHVIHSTPYRHECYACRNNVDSNHQERVPTSCRTGFSEEAESRSPSTTEQPCFSDRISLLRVSFHLVPNAKESMMYQRIPELRFRNAPIRLGSHLRAPAFAWPAWGIPHDTHAEFMRLVALSEMAYGVESAPTKRASHDDIARAAAAAGLGSANEQLNAIVAVVAADVISEAPEAPFRILDLARGRRHNASGLEESRFPYPRQNTLGTCRSRQGRDAAGRRAVSRKRYVAKPILPSDQEGFGHHAALGTALRYGHQHGSYSPSRPPRSGTPIDPTCAEARRFLRRRRLAQQPEHTSCQRSRTSR